METILICDDEVMIRSSIKRHLRKSNYRVLEAGSGDQALEIIAEKSPDLVILDVMMPGISGLETCQKIRMTIGPEIHVIMLSAMMATENKVAGFEAGADDYLTKPFAPEELLARIKSGLAGLKLRRQGAALLRSVGSSRAALPLKVLMVGQNRLAEQVMEGVLNKLGHFDVTSVERSGQALELLEKNPDFSLLIIDEGDHFESNKLLLVRTDGAAWEDIPLIVLMARASFDKMIHMKEMKVRYVVIKPVTEDSFYEKLTNAFKFKARFSPDLVERLRTMPPFSGWSLKTLSAILNVGYIKQYPPGKVIVEKGMVINKLGILISGEVAVQKEFKPDMFEEIAVLSKSGMIGDLTMLSPAPAQVRILTKSKVVLFLLPFFALTLLDAEGREEIYQVVISELSRKIREAH